MVLVEMRDSAYNKAFELLDEAKRGSKKTKLALCDLYEVLCDMYETEKGDEGDYIEDDYAGGGDYENEENYANVENLEVGEVNYKGGMRRGMRSSTDAAMRMRNNMRRGAMRMRRSRANRYMY